jgi:hypothetical protein
MGDLLKLSILKGLRKYGFFYPHQRLGTRVQVGQIVASLFLERFDHQQKK